MKVQKAKDPNNLIGFEEMHLPWIIFPEFVKRNEKFDMDVKVGEISHPMTDEHFISCITLYIDGKLYERKELKPGKSPEMKFNISLKKDSVLAARAECNLHGPWESEKKIILYRGNNSNGKGVKKNE